MSWSNNKSLIRKKIETFFESFKKNFEKENKYEEKEREKGGLEADQTEVSFPKQTLC